MTKKDDDQGGFSEQEWTAMKERAAELKTDAKRGKKADKAGFRPTSYAITDPTEKAWGARAMLMSRWWPGESPVCC